MRQRAITACRCGTPTTTDPVTHGGVRIIANPIFALDESLMVTYNRWEPEPEAVLPEPSKELAVIPKPVLDPVETIPAPKRRIPSLALLSCGVIAAMAFAVDVASAFVH